MQPSKYQWVHKSWVHKPSISKLILGFHLHLMCERDSMLYNSNSSKKESVFINYSSANLYPFFNVRQFCYKPSHVYTLRINFSFNHYPFWAYNILISSFHLENPNSLWPYTQIKCESHKYLYHKMITQNVNFAKIFNTILNNSFIYAK